MTNRFSLQSQQEQISRSQISEHLQQYGWAVGSVEPDLGEDLLVRLYENNQFTGLSCYVQLKSTKKIETLKLKNGKYSYSFEVKDLIHWQVSTTPVILVIWDTTQKLGLWRDIDDIINDLNISKRKWKNNKTTTVHFSSQANFDELGLKLLKQLLVIKLEPSMMKRDPLTINLKVSFPDTLEGTKKLNDFERSLDYGDEFEITGSTIKEFSINDWFKRFHGWFEPSDKTVIMWEPTTNDKPLFISIKTKLNNKILQETPLIKLNCEKSGRKYITFSNKSSEQPMLLNLVHEISTKSLQLNYSLRNITMSVCDALNAARFIDSMVIADFLEIRFLENGEIIESKNAGKRKLIDKQFMSLLEKTCYIQEKSGIPLSLEEFSFDSETALMISEVASIYEHGYYDLKNYLLTLQSDKDGISSLVEHFEKFDTLKLKISVENVEANLLDGVIAFGNSESEIIAELHTPMEELRQTLKTKEDSTTYPVKLFILEGKRTFPEFVT